MYKAACPRIERAGCLVAKQKGGCFGDTHHAFFPANTYRTSTEQAFRELPENKEFMCRDAHNLIHATQPIPEKPSHIEMLEAIARSALGEVELEVA